MRTLERNKTNIWYVNTGELQDVKDEDGNYTGETKVGYGEPIQSKLHLYPASGDVKERMFGKDVDIDMVTVSESVVLKKDTLIFLSEPTGEYDKTYDYKVKYILKSLNSYQYGLKGRIGNG